MPGIRKINVERFKTVYTNRAEKIFNLPYVEANMRQLAKAKAMSPHLINRFFDGDKFPAIFKSMHDADLKLPEFHRNYDEKGNLTDIGKFVRKMFLKKYDLPETAQIGDYFEAQAEKNRKDIEEIVENVKKNFDGSYSS